jgi:hypothetical protein
VRLIAGRVLLGAGIVSLAICLAFGVDAIRGYQRALSKDDFAGFSLSLHFLLYGLVPLTLSLFVARCLVDPPAIPAHWDLLQRLGRGTPCSKSFLRTFVAALCLMGAAVILLYVVLFVGQNLMDAARHYGHGARGLAIVLLLLLGLIVPSQVTWGDVGPRPSMDFEFVYETEEPLRIVEGQQMQCEEPDCADAEPLEEVGPQGLHCTDEACSSTSYGYATYNQLVIQFSDGITRTSGVFSSGTMRTDYRVTVHEDGLEVERVKGGRPRLPFVWTLIGRLLGTALAIPLGLLLLMGALLYVLGAWGRE